MPTSEQVAQVAHEANRAWCRVNGDTSQPSWGDAPDWQRDSAVAGVEYLRANPGSSDDALHENWRMQKRLDGWTYGAEKNPALKTHPCMVPFGQLPPAQQAKDRLFRAVVQALLV